MNTSVTLETTTGERNVPEPEDQDDQEEIDF